MNKSLPSSLTSLLHATAQTDDPLTAALQAAADNGVIVGEGRARAIESYTKIGRTPPDWLLRE